MVCLIKLNKTRLKELLQRWLFWCFQFLFFCVVLEFDKTHNFIFCVVNIFLLIINMLKHIMRENGRKKKASKELCINSFTFMVFFSQYHFMNSIYSNYKTNILYIFIIHLLKICQNILFLQIYFYRNGIWYWSRAFRGKKFLAVGAWIHVTCMKKGIVNLLLDFGSSIMCWFTHLSHLFVAFLSLLVHTLANNQ